MKTNASGVGLVRLRNVCDVDVVVDDDELSRVTHTHIHTHTYTEPFLILFRFFHFQSVEETVGSVFRGKDDAATATQSAVRVN